MMEMQLNDEEVPSANAVQRNFLRVQRERESVARGRAELDAGLGIGLEDLEAWFEQLERDPGAPIPAPSR